MSLSLAERVSGAVDRLPRVPVQQTPGTLARPLLSTIERLDDAAVLRADRWLSWLVTIVIGVFAFAIRLVDLAEPTNLVFDETYYAKDAWALLNFGYEVNWPEDANDQIVAGTTTNWESGAAFVVHPQLGKWLIAIGIHFFGMNSFGWRISAVVFGTLLVMATIRMARRLARSTLIGAMAGLLLTVDGLSFVMSRIALLDVFQATFTVLAVACLVADRDWFRAALAEHLRRHGLADLGGGYGPLLLWRPWRWAAGVGFGLAIACKWNSVYVLAAMGVLVVVHDISSRRTAGAGWRSFRALFIDAPIAFVALVVTALVVYVASWWSWLRTSGGWGRDFGVRNPDDFWVRHVGDGLGSLVHHHKEIFGFHTGEWIAGQTHVYESHPFQWLVMGRTIGIHAENDIAAGVDGCPAASGETCVRIISGMGTPLLWWLALAAILAGLALWWLGRDWRFAVPLVAGLTPWLAWMPNAERPLFFFYAIVIIPFTATVLAMLLGKVLGPADAGRRRRRGAIAVGTIMVAIVVNFWFIYPVLTAQLMTRDAWELRMWFGSWI
ncbi:MAG: phospholipid carrier-dependent glycosyltransferase [Brooklawnia sp.]|uniref:dolichyl-phosphate-mannose--protein mannosyltransferase n=1 Tax=Brooklawnia sp. TaxID=2699740 RepID=UPI003C787ECB